MLEAHTTHMFDTRILLLHLRECNLIEEFRQKVDGFLDTLPLSRQLYPERKGAGGYKQEALVQDLVKQSYSAHNAIDDVAALEKLLGVMKTSSKFTTQLFSSHSLSFDSASTNMITRFLHEKTLKQCKCLLMTRFYQYPWQKRQQHRVSRCRILHVLLNAALVAFRTCLVNGILTIRH